MPEAPDLTTILNVWWGGAYQSTVISGLISEASNFVYSANPAYSLNDFLVMYPKFFGPVTAVEGTTSASSTLVLALSATQNLAAGQFLTCPSVLANNTLIASVDTVNNALTLSSAALASGMNPLNVYTAPLVPVPVLNAFISLAVSSLSMGRWGELWSTGVGLYVAHFCTLWLQSEGQPVSLPGQAASSGLYRGMLTHKAAGDVSTGYWNMMNDFSDWGAWTLTTYGTQLITMAKIVGWGSAYIW